MEYFARSPEVIAKWATHYLTKEPVPREMLDAALRRKVGSASLDLHNQILYSAADQVHFIHYLCEFFSY